MPTHLFPLPFPCTLLLGVLTATDKSVTLVSQFSSSSGEWVWWGFKQWRNFACFLYVPPPPFFFRAIPFIWGRRDVMFCCSAVFVSVLCQKKALCVQGFTVCYARKGKGTSLFDIFFPHVLLAGRCTWKIKDHSDPLFVFFFKGTVSIWELYFWGLVTFCCIQGTIHQHCNHAACSLPQNRATNKLICVIHTVCIIKAYRQECLSLALFVLPV